MQIGLRQAAGDDEAFLRRVFVSVYAPRFAALPAAEQSFLLEIQYQALTQSRRETYPTAATSIILVDGEPAGFCSTITRDSRVLLIDIALLPGFRNRGIGTVILQDIIEAARATGSGIDLSVERSSPALRLYERLGFSVIAGEGPYVTMQFAGQFAGPYQTA